MPSSISLDLESLKAKTRKIRKNIIKMIYLAGSGHTGGSLSSVEILTALYFNVLRISPENPDWSDRDRFILSKGHGCPALYATLAERGFFPEKDLWGLRKIDSHLEGHPDMNKTPGVDMTSGSLGNGFACALGMAIAAKARGRDFRVFSLLGDGELQEGIVWEVAMAAANQQLDNFVAIIDYNGLQITGWVNKVSRIEPLAKKWEAFGWMPIEVDGNDVGQMLHAFQRSQKTGGPTVIIAHTVKGKGVSFMENNADWHGKALDNAHMERALEEIMEGC